MTRPSRGYAFRGSPPNIKEENDATCARELIQDEEKALIAKGMQVVQMAEAERATLKRARSDGVWDIAAQKFKKETEEIRAIAKSKGLEGVIMATLNDQSKVDGTTKSPRLLETPGGSSEYTANRDEQTGPTAPVVQVSATRVRYRLRCIADSQAMLK